MSSKITKEKAKQCVEYLTQGKLEQLKQTEQNLKQEVKDLYIQQIPKQVLDLIGKNSKYIRKSLSIKVRDDNGHFIHSFHYNSKHTIIPANDDFNKATITLVSTNTDNRHLIDRINKYNDDKSQLQKTTTQLNSIIYNLKTFNRVKQNFPEVSHLLTQKQTTAQVSNINQVRNQLGLKVY